MTSLKIGMPSSAFGPERPVASRLATAGARQAVRACALRPTLAGGQRGSLRSSRQHCVFASLPGRPRLGPAIAHPNHPPRCHRAPRRNAPRAQPGRAFAEALRRPQSSRHDTTGSAKPLVGRPRRVSGAPRRRAGTQTVRGTVCALRAVGPEGPGRPARPGLAALARSATRLLTRRACLSRVSEANAASSRRGPRDRAPQGSRSEAQTAPATRRGLPASGFAAPPSERPLWAVSQS